MEGEEGENNQPINKKPTREHYYYFKYTGHYMKLPGLTLANKGRPGRLKETGMGRDTAAGHPPRPPPHGFGIS